MRTILSFELQKLLKRFSALAAIFASLLALVALFYIHFQNSQVYGHSADVHGREAIALYQQFAEEHSGPVTKELLTETITDYVMLSEAEPDYFNVFGYYVTERFDHQFMVYMSQLGKDEAVDFSQIKPKSGQKLGSTLPLKDLKLGGFVTWNQLFLVSNSAYILVLLLSVYLSAPLFSGDTAKQMNPLLLTTKYGRNKLTVAKLTSSLWISTSLFVVFNAIILAVFAWYFGFSGWDTSVQLNLHWMTPFENIMAFPEKLTLLSTFVNLIVFQFIGLVFITAVNALVSSKTKSPLTTFAVSAGAIFVPSFLLQVFQGGLIHKLLTIVSVSTSNTAGLMLQLSHQGPQGFFFDNFWINGLSLIAVRSILAALLCFLTYGQLKKTHS